ncbi:hypothetical protein TNCV_4392161 [Trichonephila clavipes]|nr:hypothetical protein TNCV_4392161 [Trichonephila clavipes]
MRVTINVVATKPILSKARLLTPGETWKGGEEKKKEKDEREESGLGWRKGKSPALDGEGMRGEPWLKRARKKKPESEIGVERR